MDIEDFEHRSGLVAGHVIRNKGHLKLTRLYDLIFHPQVLDAVESVLGPDILCWGSSLFVKEGPLRLFPEGPGAHSRHGSGNRRLRRPPLRRHAVGRRNNRHDKPGGLNLLQIDTGVEKLKMWIARSGLVLLVFGVGILVRDAIVQSRKRH